MPGLMWRHLRHPRDVGIMPPTTPALKGGGLVAVRSLPPMHSMMQVTRG
jgi:hypothetical protein